MPTDTACLIEVVKPGLATSVQDTGRQGYYYVGIPPSGALDQFSLRAANLLVGNNEDAAALECTLLGPQLVFHTDTLIAVTGAEMTPDHVIGPDRKVVAVLCGKQEQHISADVAYAVWQYWQATGDEARCRGISRRKRPSTHTWNRFVTEWAATVCR